MDYMSFIRFVASPIRKNQKLFRLLRRTIQEIFPDSVVVLDYPLTPRQKQNQQFLDLLKKITQEIFPDSVVVLDYPLHSRQRWDIEHPHRELYDIINENRNLYKHHLQSFLPLSEYFINIERQTQNAASAEPYWINGSMPALDGVALYGFMAMNRPKYYIEVGSGNSTKFARKAIIDHALDTKIISIDVHPRIEIDNICDEIIRKPVENIGVEVFDCLSTNDILYIDGSHRIFMNSDATTVFLEVIPRLRSGVLVEIHDVFLPYDYPAEWIDRYYSEQYLLAAYLLAKGSGFDIVLPNMFISHDPELRSILSPLWGKEEMRNVETHGGSFWMRVK
jgi:hypothetical protein